MNKNEKYVRLAITNAKISLINSTKTVMGKLFYHIEIPQDLQITIQFPTNKFSPEQFEEIAETLSEKDKIILAKKIEMVKESLGHAKTIEAITQLKAIQNKWENFLNINGIDIEDDLIHLSARYKDNEKYIRSNTISLADSRLESNLIRDAILKIAKDIGRLC